MIAPRRSGLAEGVGVALTEEPAIELLGRTESEMLVFDLA